jgi:AAA ATPase domain
MVVLAIERLRPGPTVMPAAWRSGMYGSSLFGREAEVAILDQFVNRIPDRGGALVLRGDPGIGKTELLSVASAAASSKGMSVLHTAGTQSEVSLAFAGLHQLLRPVLTELDRLPDPQRGALSAALGMTDALAPDPFLIALAALNLLASAAERVPLLLIAAWRPSRSR